MPNPSHRPRKPRWRRRKEARPAEICAAALELFAERGFAATRLDQVAARAGVSKGTLYLYFRSKEELFHAVVRQSLLPILAAAEQTLQQQPERPTAALLAELLEHLAAGILRTRVGAIPKLVIAESGNFPDLARFYFDEVVSRGLRAMESVLQRGIARGELRPVDKAHAARLVIAPMLLLLFWKATFERHAGAPLDERAFLAAHLDLLMHGLAKPVRRR